MLSTIGGKTLTILKYELSIQYYKAENKTVLITYLLAKGYAC